VRPATSSDTHSSRTLAFAHQEVNAEVDRHACEDGERGCADDVDLGLDEHDESDGDCKAAQHGNHELHDRSEVAKEHQHHQQRAQSGEDRDQAKVVQDDAVLERSHTIAANDFDLCALWLRLNQWDGDGFGALLDHPGIAEVSRRAAQHDLHGADRALVVAQWLRPFVAFSAATGLLGGFARELPEHRSRRRKVDGLSDGVAVGKLRGIRNRHAQR